MARKPSKKKAEQAAKPKPAPKPIPPCCVCGCRNSGFGVGDIWYCATHWKWLPSTQAFFIADKLRLVDEENA
jgi:hypothetical protein